MNIQRQFQNHSLIFNIKNFIKRLIIYYLETTTPFIIIIIITQLIICLLIQL